MMEELKVYWAPGCTSCLRMKEFLTRHGVEFTSINVFENPAGMEDLAKLGIRRVPIAARGKEWADGQVLEELARVGGFQFGARIVLPPAELVERADVFMAKAFSLLEQIPEEKLDLNLPDRLTRSYRQLGDHIFRIIEIFLKVAETGQRAEVIEYSQGPPDVHTLGQLLGYGKDVRRRFDAWWALAGENTDFTATANVYYNSNMHEFLERSAWHAGQHTRQLQAVVENLGIIPVSPITAEDLAGLPMPKHIYDDKRDLDDRELVAGAPYSRT